MSEDGPSAASAGGSGESSERASEREDGNADTGAEDALAELFAVIEDRKAHLPEDSYTASLFTHEKGENAVLEKLGEETTELVLAAKDGEREDLAHESADLVYHLLVLLAMKDMDVEDLLAELRARR
ncbi:phosphoribosyl-ATP diphosphatase [Halobacteriales archaeon QS_5_70_17]|nr:MAG: phosphoribosyl-ATP diphosphatase [Halobacteriales archaeon QS_5_70_17]